MVRRSSAVIGLPDHNTWPEVGLSTPTIIRIVVVLPAPLAPTKPVIRPAGMSKFRWSTATRSSKARMSSSTRTDTGSRWHMSVSIMATSCVLDLRSHDHHTQFLVIAHRRQDGFQSREGSPTRMSPDS